MTDLHVTVATPAEAAELVEVIHAAFRARPALDPPSTALSENLATVGAAIGAGGGLMARVDGEPAGAMLLQEKDGWLGLRRVSVHPNFQRRGVATAMVGCAEEEAIARGLVGVGLQARVELPETLEFWRRRGYAVLERTGQSLTLAKVMPVELRISDEDQMRALGARLAELVRPGDVVLLSGELGAGKTTLTQGIGAGLGVRGAVTSPTFVIARAHPNLAEGPPLVHVDAYRLHGDLELDDLDLDTAIVDAVTVVEWGTGIAEGLAEDRLEVEIGRLIGHASTDGAATDEAMSVGGTPADIAGPRMSGASAAPGAGADPGAEESTEEFDTDVRTVRVSPVGPRWANLRPNWLGGTTDRYEAASTVSAEASRHDDVPGA